METRAKDDCQVCKYIRWYLLIGLPMLVITWLQPEMNIFRGLDLSMIAATGIMIGLVTLIIWKYINERKR